MQAQIVAEILWYSKAGILGELRSWPARGCYGLAEEHKNLHPDRLNGASDIPPNYLGYLIGGVLRLV